MKNLVTFFDRSLTEPVWDVIVIGTGMGGATLGYALAKSGLKVLFCEQGKEMDANQDILKGVYPESYFSKIQPDGEKKEILRNAGRYSEKIYLDDKQKTQSFIPLIGEGVGGSSTLYGMVMERFGDKDFSSPLWPFKLEQLAPFYQKAEELYQVNLVNPPPLTAANAEIYSSFTKNGVNPQRLPMACSFKADCRTCQNFLCLQDCKKHAGNIAVKKALEDYGAVLATNCQVIKLGAENRMIKTVYCKMNGYDLELKGRIIALAAGAINTPALLLRSKHEGALDGVGNSSGLVGKNLMRHYIDLYAIPTTTPPEPGSANKQLSINDFYNGNGIKSGILQSFGRLPPTDIILDDMKEDILHKTGQLGVGLFRIVQPIVHYAIERKLSRSVLIASIMEDEGREENRVYPETKDGLCRTHIHYTISDDEKIRIKEFRQQVSQFLKTCGYHFMLLKQAENNKRLAHVCGTCRSGTDPKTSVLDIWNKSHDVDNLYVVDASFFPTSGTSNPALTIAANALRVAERIIEMNIVSNIFYEP